MDNIPAYFEDLLIKNGFVLDKEKDEKWSEPQEIDIYPWLPATNRSISSLLRHTRKQTSSVTSAIGVLSKLSRLHEEQGLQLEAKLIKEACGLCPPIPYNDVHTHYGYKFSSATYPSTFAKAVISQNIIQNRVVADVGCGNGRDVIGYVAAGAKKVVGLDSSPFIYQRFIERVRGLDEDLQNCILAICSDMNDLLKMNPDLARSVDIVTWNSVLHLFPRSHLHAYLRWISENILTAEGIVGASIKTPESFFNKSGILLDKWNTGNSRLCIDGQYRWFEQPDSFLREVQTQFPNLLYKKVRTNMRSDSSTDERIDVIAKK